MYFHLFNFNNFNGVFGIEVFSISKYSDIWYYIGGLLSECECLRVLIGKDKIKHKHKLQNKTNKQSDNYNMTLCKWIDIKNDMRWN